MSEKDTYFQSKTSLNTWNEGYPDNCLRLAGRTAAHALASARWAGREGNSAGLICLKLEIFLTTKNTKATKKLILGSLGPSAWVPYRNSCSVLTP